MTCGALYHATLATGLQKVGYAVAVRGRNGIFELVGSASPALPNAANQYFSARRRESRRGWPSMRWQEPRRRFLQQLSPVDSAPIDQAESDCFAQ
ncbi:MAG: hypothetical protein K2Y56_19595 [Methylobacterium sp.]|uniref:hypothetical protein n=1 Tax=Methylobacterium sp. TaxID=409 RepID=UPI0034559FC2|nr:hypothetical protein [Methylobacterium sp.]